MREVILAKSGEIMMKGQNRGMFENRLMENTRTMLAGLGKCKVYHAQSTFYIEPSAGVNVDLVMAQVCRVFGYSAVARCCVVEKDFEKICIAAASYLKDQLHQAKTFKVEAKRSDKRFPMASPEICRKLGAYLLEQYPHLTVDVHHPELEVMVEIRDFDAFVHPDQVRGAGGMPVGTAGSGALLISGGIDSPVAGYMMAKRGLELVGIHFESPPYTSARALDKVEKLCEKVSLWSGPIKLYVVPFTHAQEEIHKHCADGYMTLVMRRLMMRVAQQLAKREGCGALITGECVGQVASQTLGALACTDVVVDVLPVLRPVVGLDKEEIVQIARKIDTYETAILPYEDCCTVFTPKRPKTNPAIADVEREEQALDVNQLVEECLAATQVRWIGKP